MSRQSAAVRWLGLFVFGVAVLGAVGCKDSTTKSSSGTPENSVMKIPDTARIGGMKGKAR